MVDVRQALGVGRREALEALAEQLAAEIATQEGARDRLPTIRAFLATCAQLEALDRAAALARIRTERRSAVHVDSGALSGPVDELLARRRASRAS